MAGRQSGYPAMFFPSVLTNVKELKSELYPRNTGKQIWNQDIYLHYSFSAGSGFRRVPESHLRQELPDTEQVNIMTGQVEKSITWNVQLPY